MSKTIATGLWIAAAFAIAAMFYKFAFGMIGSTQDDVIQHQKQIEDY